MNPEPCEAVGTVMGLVGGVILGTLLAPWILTAIVLRRIQELTQGFDFDRSTIEDIGVINWLIDTQ